MTGGALIVAAGFSRRFGSDKRLFQLTGGEPLLVATLRPYRAAFTNVAVVVRSSDSELSRQIVHQFGRDVPIIIPTEIAHQGMSASISDGVRALWSWDYLFLGLGDMPYVRSTTLQTLRLSMEAARKRSEPRIVVPVCSTAPGHPVGFSREFFAELIALHGDQGARAIVTGHPKSVTRIEVEDDGVVRDIDKPPARGD